MKKEKIILYNGANFCGSCGQCPMVEYYPDKDLVKIGDPAKPERGKFHMSAEEYRSLIANAKKI